MTDTQHDLGAAEFVSAFASRQLPILEATALPQVDGPLTVTTFVEPTQPDAPVVTVAVASNGDLEFSDVACEAVLAVRPDLEAGPPLSVDSLEAAGTELPGPDVAQLFEITSGGGAIGVAIIRTDRRRQESDPSTISPSDPGPATPVSTGHSGHELSLLGEVKLEVAVELGRQTLTLAHMLGLKVGSVVELDRAAGAPVDIRVNGLLYGHGEVVVVNDQYAVRIIEIVENSGI